MHHEAVTVHVCVHHHHRRQLYEEPAAVTPEWEVSSTQTHISSAASMEESEASAVSGYKSPLNSEGHDAPSIQCWLKDISWSCMLLHSILIHPQSKIRKLYLIN